MKKCSKCKVNKPLSSFNKDKQRKSGYYPSCKECCTKKYKKWYSKQESKDLCKELSSQWRKDNKEYKSIQDKEYRKNNRDKLNKYYREKYNNDGTYRLLHNLRNRHKDFITGRRFSKGMKELLGCDPEVFKYWIEYSSLPNIKNPTYDHIIPCEWFNKQGWTKEYESICFHWSNYRLCSNEENISKHDNIYPLLINDYNNLANKFIEHCNDIGIQISVPSPLRKIWVAESN